MLGALGVFTGFQGEEVPSRRHTLTCMSRCPFRSRSELDTLQIACRELSGFSAAYSRLPVHPRGSDFLAVRDAWRRLGIAEALLARRPRCSGTEAPSS